MVADRKAKCAKHLLTSRINHVNKKNQNTPGYTAEENSILHEMLDVICDFVSKDNWETQLPIEVSRSFVHAILGNHVRFTCKLYTESNKNNN